MANTKQALKRSRQAEKHRMQNKWQFSRLNTYLKRVLAAIKSGNVENAKSEYRLAISIADRLANKGLIHKNKADRHKQRLNKHIQAMSAS